MEKALNAGSKIATELSIPIRIVTPIISLSKADIIRRGLEIKAPLELTWSCYAGGDFPCGVCDSCILRETSAFSEVGIPDLALTTRSR